MNDSKTSNDSGKSKHKKKVSFSIFEISTFDELAKLRKMREEELDYFVINKKKTNQYLNNLNQRNKILSLSNNELLSLDNNTNSIDNINSRNIHIQKNTSIPKPLRKEILGDFSNNNILNINYKNKYNNRNNINFNRRTLFSDEEEMKTNELFPSIPQINSIEKTEIIADINNLKQNNININNNNSVNNIEDELNNIKKLNNINNIIDKDDKNNNIENNDDNLLKEDNNINNNNDINNINNIENNENIEENNNIEVEENNDKINKSKINIISLFDTLEKIFNISPVFYIYYIKEFFSNLNQFIDKKMDLYIDYESTDPSYAEEIKKKSELIHQKIYFNYFLNEIRAISKRNKIHKEHLLKAKKYKEYLNYKYKAYAFNNLYTFGKKQKEWIKNIQIGFKRKLVWDCVDSLKLYTNYKKIKNYLRTRKKKKIFDVLKNNKQLSIKLLKSGKKLSLIFEYRHFFNNCRKKILAKKGKEINDKLVEEFRNQNLMRNIFALIRLNCEIKKEKKNRYENIIMKNKIKNDNFINIKVTRKETVKFNNGSTLMRIQNKINVI